VSSAAPAAHGAAPLPAHASPPPISEYEHREALIAKHDRLPGQLRWDDHAELHDAESGVSQRAHEFAGVLGPGSETEIMLHWAHKFGGPEGGLRWNPRARLPGNPLDAAAELEKRLSEEEQATGRRPDGEARRWHESELMREHPHSFARVASGVPPVGAPLPAASPEGGLRGAQGVGAQGVAGAVEEGRRLRPLATGFVDYVATFLAHYGAGIHVVNHLMRKALPIERGGIELFTKENVEQRVAAVRQQYSKFHQLAEASTELAAVAAHMPTDPSARGVHIAQMGNLAAVPRAEENWMDPETYKLYFRGLDEELQRLAKHYAAAPNSATAKATAALQRLLVEFGELHTLVGRILAEVNFPRFPHDIRRQARLQERGHVGSLDLPGLEERPGAALHAAHRTASEWSKVPQALLLLLPRALEEDKEAEREVNELMEKTQARVGGDAEGFLRALGLSSLPESDQRKLLEISTDGATGAGGYDFYEELLRLLRRVHAHADR